ncbi:MAG: hypothetical protein CVT48_06665 [Thermoplasmata archaeon HGW-Thermoplasmata-1]|nr:MAG: hypothetical protein CVT48_06665 [Thermoplasmata archaeon HGW-Thermoplasmata-1]
MENEKIIAFSLKMNDLSEYQRLIKPPQSVGMHSGRVVVQKGGNVGEHSTENYEEMLIILGGFGKAEIEGDPITQEKRVLPLEAGTIVYIPPHKKHDVFNTGKGELSYIFVVSQIS